MTDNGEDYVHQSVRGEVVSQIHRLRKHTDNIIKGNTKTFQSLKNVQTVFIFGLSFSPVDLPYLDEVVGKVNVATTTWRVSYYSDDDREMADSYFTQKKIDKALVGYMKLNDLMLMKQTELQFEV